MGNTEYFELCEISSKIQCPDCSLYRELDIVYCTCGKRLQPTERNRQLNKERYDVLSIPNYVIKKNPSHGVRHGPTERQKIYYKAHNMLKKGPEKAVQHHLGKISKIFSLSRLINLNSMGWQHHYCIRRNRKRGPLLQCDEREWSWRRTVTKIHRISIGEVGKVDQLKLAKKAKTRSDNNISDGYVEHIQWSFFLRQNMTDTKHNLRPSGKQTMAVTKLEVPRSGYGYIYIYMCWVHPSTLSIGIWGQFARGKGEWR